MIIFGMIVFILVWLSWSMYTEAKEIIAKADYRNEQEFKDN